MRINRFIKAEAEARREADTSDFGNICGVLVHAKPGKMDAVKIGLTTIPGVEIHQATDDGRLVVTVEDTPGSWAAETIKNFTEIEGVLSAALVYHYCGSQDMAGEISS
jgi:nitrate reductase NapD